ncbi:MAG TPA: hypothetical protein DD727_05315 [Clostridiales bacterium]|nr:hypothetical protein [Clostridiales bacterium]
MKINRQQRICIALTVFLMILTGCGRMSGAASPGGGTGASSARTGMGGTANMETSPAGIPVTLSLYFATTGAEYVKEEKREALLPTGSSLEWLALTELMKGPKEGSLYPVIPEGTRLLSAVTLDGTCTVDFSREFVSNANVGTAGESMIISGIVNTLTSLPEIRQVKFLVEGQGRPAYIHMVFDQPFVRDESSIAR